MATLDRVIELQGQGLSETEISSQLQSEGISPREVSDSLNQAKIKNAVSSQEKMPLPQGTRGMQQSIMQENPQEQPAPMQQGPEMEMPPAQPNPEIYQGQAEQPQDDYYTQTPQVCYRYTHLLQKLDKHK